MILIGGRIFVIFSNLDKTLPACQWDDDNGWNFFLQFLMVMFSYNHAKH